jgi:hypothetical protein
LRAAYIPKLGAKLTGSGPIGERAACRHHFSSSQKQKGHPLIIQEVA